MLDHALEKPYVKKGKITAWYRGATGDSYVTNGYYRVSEFRYGGVLYIDQVSLITKTDGTPLKPIDGGVDRRYFVTKEFAILSVYRRADQFEFIINLFMAENGLVSQCEIEKGSIPIPLPSTLAAHTPKQFCDAITAAITMLPSI